MDATGIDRRALRALLAFYDEAGVDAALSETGVDRFAPPAASAPEATFDADPPAQDERPAPRRRHAAGAPAASPARTAEIPATAADGAAMAAREAAATAATLEELRATLAGFEGCSLRFTATNLVFADGDPQARLMFVGEAPGEDEDRLGLPFVGRSGQLLDRMLAAIGLARSAVYIANVVPWRPPGNRTPTPQETEICRPFIRRQIELVDPDLLVTLGGAATNQVLDTSEGISRLRGKWRSYATGRRSIRAMAMLHPAYLLRSPLQKRLAWRDMLALKAALEGRE